MNIAKQQECRICKGNLDDVLDLGTIYRSSFIKEGEKIPEDQKAPLVLVKCKDCGLVQLKDTIDLDLMYKNQYWYSSSLNKSMVSSLKDIVDEIENIVELGHDTVVDIGCNDGTLFKQYSSPYIVKVGYDPSINLSAQAKENCDIFINDYFSKESFPQKIKKAKVITAIAMFYDLPDPNKFIEDVKSILSKDGIFVVQFTDLLSMFKVCAFDNICHEHLEYYRLKDVVTLLRNHGLSVIDASYNDVNGGSVRIIACHDGAYPLNSRVITALVREKQYFAEHDFDYFKNRIETVKLRVKEFLKWAEFHGHEVFILGASTKGNTFLQVCEITDKQVPYAAEVNKDKFGLRTLGSNIKIISEDEALIKHPAYFIVPVWHFKDNILSNSKIKDYMHSGGKLIFPLPEFEIFVDSYGKITGFKI